MKVKAVIFDYGGVLCLLPGEQKIEALARAAGLQTPELLRWFWHYRLAYDRGDLTDWQFWKSIGNSTGKIYTEAQVADFVEQDVNFWLTLDEKMLDWNRTLRAAGFLTAVLSNMPEPLGIHLRQHTRLLEEFDAVTLSYEIRSAKPEAKIYKHTLATLGIKAGDALFLDDKTPNVHAAQATGLHAIEYINRIQLAGRETQYGLPPVPA